jgi:hypothetical protein|nr:MAG TPA: hypothetical protein [Caudoviricetes sp.]
MLIRSQDKTILLNFSNSTVVYIAKNDKDFVISSLENENRYKLGKYSSEAKAMKVLNMIQEAYCKFMSVKNDDAWDGKESVFYMPEDSEVES